MLLPGRPRARKAAGPTAAPPGKPGAAAARDRAHSREDDPRRDAEGVKASRDESDEPHD